MTQANYPSWTRRFQLSAVTCSFAATLSFARPALGIAQFFEVAGIDGHVSFSHVVPNPDRLSRPISFPARRSRRALRTSNRLPFEQRLALCRPHVADAARRYSLPEAYLLAVATVESRFDPRAVSVDGAAGVMQLMPFTATKMGVNDPFDPRQNIFGGARFLRILANRWHGDLALTTASYNAGAGAVEKYGGIPPFPETQRYVAKVTGLYRRLKSSHQAATPVPSSTMRGQTQALGGQS
jgi:hypothetical protein